MRTMTLHPPHEPDRIKSFIKHKVIERVGRTKMILLFIYRWIKAQCEMKHPGSRHKPIEHQKRDNNGNKEATEKLALNRLLGQKKDCLSLQCWYSM